MNKVDIIVPPCRGTNTTEFELVVLSKKNPSTYIAHGMNYLCHRR